MFEKEGGVLFLTLLVLSQPLVGSEEIIRLGGIPERLVLPLPTGTNLVLTAEVSGGAAHAVWLARTETSPTRLLLAKVGENQYQINLACSDVQKLLSSDPAGGEFQIFAERTEGGVVASIPVRYAVRSAEPKEPPSLHLVYRGGREEDAGRWWNGRWCEVDQLDRLELHFNTLCLDRSATAAGATLKPLPFEAGSGAQHVLLLPITPELASGWNQNGKLTIKSRQCDRDLLPDFLRALPTRLDIPGALASVTVPHGRGGFIPGSRDFLLVRLGKIGGGQAFMSISKDVGELLLRDAPVRQGDVVQFQFGDIEYNLLVAKMVNVLGGEDYSVLAVAELEPHELQDIRRILDIIERSDAIFLCDKRPMSGSETARHIWRKLEQADSKTQIGEEFIERVAHLASNADRPCQVKLPDGKTIGAVEWLKGVSARPGSLPVNAK